MKTRNTIIIVASVLAIWILSVKLMDAQHIWFWGVGVIAAIGLTWYAVRRRGCGCQCDKSADRD